MDISITTCHLDRRADLIDFARRRVGFALARFTDLVREVEVRLVDVNGPRGGYGITCLARLRLHDGAEVLVQSSAVTPEDGIAQVLPRLSNRLRRVLDRRHEHR